MEKPPIPFDAIPILATLKAEERAELSPLCELQAYEKGATIFQEGEPAEKIDFLFVGRVKIVKSTPDRDLILEILGPGEPVGTVAAFERRPFPATAVAIEPSGVVSIRERDFFALIERRPEITRRLLAGLTLRLIILNKRLADMTGSVEYRMARLFSTLAERTGRKQGKEIFIPLLSRARRSPTWRARRSRRRFASMSRWQKDNIIETDKTGFFIRDFAALQGFAPAE